jgi:hypothetical protein
MTAKPALDLSRGRRRPPRSRCAIDRGQASRPVLSVVPRKAENDEGAISCCGRCGILYREIAWRALTLIERIDFGAVRHLVSAWPWPQEVVLAIRKCPCGGRAVGRELTLRRAGTT